MSTRQPVVTTAGLGASASFASLAATLPTGSPANTSDDLSRSQYTVFLQHWSCWFIAGICTLLAIGKRLKKDMYFCSPLWQNLCQKSRYKKIFFYFQVWLVTKSTCMWSFTRRLKNKLGLFEFFSLFLFIPFVHG